MDGTSFDALAKRLATRVTRRRAVAGLLGLAGGVGALTATTDAATRRCRLAGDKCVNPAQCCTGLCDQRRSIPRGQRNRCICPSGLISCKGYCTQLGTEENCSRCGDACHATQVCEDRTCVCPDPDTTWCRGANACVPLASDEQNCGRCGRKCGPTQVCDNGTCICPDPDTVFCRSVNTCVPLGTEENCLACGDACGAGEGCCGSAGCVELGTMDNCSECGDVCTPGGTGSSTIFCNGADGCETYCQAAAGGFVTTDDPPVIYPGSVANNYNHLTYLNPSAPNPSQFQTCVTTADCTATCPTTTAFGDVAACACTKYSCKSNGTENSHFINIWNEVPADTYVCMTLLKP